MDFTAYLADLERARPQGVPENLVVLRSTGSTNHLAREVVAEYEREAQHLHPVLVVALEQVGGRGRQGRGWSSPAGKGVYATRALAVDDPERLHSLPLLAGIGLVRGLAPLLPVPVQLKWPNDLVVETAAGRRKIGGILIEAQVRPGEGATALIGFGVNHSHMADEMPETGTSLRLLGGSATLPELTWALAAGLERELAHLGDEAYAVEAYRGLVVHRPGDPVSCRVGDGMVEGRFVGIDDRGRLVLEREGEELRLAAGEVIE